MSGYARKRPWPDPGCNTSTNWEVLHSARGMRAGLLDDAPSRFFSETAVGGWTLAGSRPYFTRELQESIWRQWPCVDIQAFYVVSIARVNKGSGNTADRQRARRTLHAGQDRESAVAPMMCGVARAKVGPARLDPCKKALTGDRRGLFLSLSALVM